MGVGNVGNVLGKSSTPNPSSPRTSEVGSVTFVFLGFRIYGPPLLDRIWGIWGSSSTIPKAMFYVLRGTVGFRVSGLSCRV